MKKSYIVAAISSFAIGISGVLGLHASAASVPDEQWNLPINAPGQDMAELIGLKIANAASGIDQPSYLVGDSVGNNQNIDKTICSSINDQPCKNSVKTFYLAYLAPCSSTVTINCISSVSAVDPSGKEFPGQYVKNFPSAGSNDYPGDENVNLPAGSSPSVWKIPGVSHGGNEDNYLLRYSLQGGADKGANFSAYSIQASLFPFTTITGNYHVPHLVDANHPTDTCLQNNYKCGFGSAINGDSNQLSAACVSFEVGYCALRQAFPSGYRFRIVAKIGNSPTGWFHGRFASPLVTLTPTGSATTLSVEASPVLVPAVGAIIKQADETPEMRNFYGRNPMGKGISFGQLSPNGISNYLSMPEPSDSGVFNEFSLWSSIFKDKATATQSEWSFRTLQLNGEGNRCINDPSKLVGVVATNAMMYSGGAPGFNAGEGSLDYKVGAPHYSSNGDVFKGSYDLQLRSDVARCLYNFSNAPVKATISISNETGDSNIATTIFTEDKDSGWMHMSASNFTFSNPTLKIKFTQDAPVAVPTPSPSATPTPSSTPSPVATTPTQTAVAQPVAKKITITCVKGKTIKTVAAVKPTCPAGYKKK